MWEGEYLLRKTANKPSCLGIRIAPEIQNDFHSSHRCQLQKRGLSSTNDSPLSEAL